MGHSWGIGWFFCFEADWEEFFLLVWGACMFALAEADAAFASQAVQDLPNEEDPLWDPIEAQPSVTFLTTCKHWPRVQE